MDSFLLVNVLVWFLGRFFWGGLVKTVELNDCQTRSHE